MGRLLASACLCLVTGLARAQDEEQPPPDLRAVYRGDYLRATPVDDQLKALKAAIVDESLDAVVSLLTGPNASHVVEKFFEKKPPDADKKRYNLDRPRFSKKDDGKNKENKEADQSQQTKSELMQAAAATRDPLIIAPLADAQLLLRKTSRYLNVKGRRGETALMVASARDCSDARNATVMRALLEMGADVEVRADRGGYSALMVAAASANIPAIKMLLEKGADVNARDGMDVRPVDVVEMLKSTNISEHHMQVHGDPEEAMAVLRSAGGISGGPEGIALDWELPDGPQFYVSMFCYTIVALMALNYLSKQWEKSHYRGVLHPIYAKHCPKKLETLEQLLDFWASKLPALQVEVEKTYLRPVFKPQLIALYKKKAPEMLEKVDFILDHYAGKYETLKRMLTDKYGAEGVLKDEPLAAGSSEEGKKMQ